MRNLIVIEEVLSEVFLQMPERQTGFKPVYKWGNQFHLIKQLTLFKKNNKSAYPLIYQTSTQSTQDTARHEATTNLVLVISTVNKDISLTNEQRWAMSYRNVLYPVVEDVVACFKRAGVFNWDGIFKISEFPNFGDDKENYTIEIWDAIMFETTITIEVKANGDPKCINKNIFKNV